ncbi:MAG: zinc-dependent metalloprotease [Deltaproteobacteria bacterium]|nr:zinc-dependent metalloprotease [Deltaproteobacteria bacterium]
MSTRNGMTRSGWRGFAAALLLLAGCGSQAQDEGLERGRATIDPQIENTFSLEGPDKKLIAIKKAALEKDLLLQANITMQFWDPDFWGIKSRVVFFKKLDGKLFLFESSKDYNFVADDAWKPELILASFKILKETDEAITFDFNQGMKAILYGDEWWASDFGWWTDKMPIPLGESYVKKARLTDREALVVNQIANLSDDWGGTSYEIVYYLSAYRPDPTFRPMESKWNFDRFGFFEVQPLVNAERSTIDSFYTKFNKNKPIVYAMSSNTPAAFKEAVRDGVNYWNKVWGSGTQIQVIDAPKGVTAPDHDYNVIQWVEDKTAGYAFADAQMDPRTGQVMHAQIFMPSFWAVYSADQARDLLRRLETEETDRLARLAKKQKGKKHARLGLKKLSTEHLCKMDVKRRLRSFLKRINLRTASDAQILRVAQDLVREVVAHEVGHTLGLRHNFAGSIGTNISADDAEKRFEEYLNGKMLATDVIPSSSVMDYHDTPQSALIGHLIARKEAALPYDVKAMSILYDGETYDPREIPPFCTDSHYGYYHDCDAFDAGRSVIEFATSHKKKLLENLPNILFEWYVWDKAPCKGCDEFPLAEDQPNPKWFLYSLTYPVTSAYRSLLSSSKTIRIQRSFPTVSALNAAKVQRAELDYARREYDAAGGFEKVLSILPKDYAKTAIAKFDALVNRYTTFPGYEGQTVHFSGAEKELIKQHARKFFRLMETQAAEEEMTILSNLPNWIDLAYMEWGWMNPLMGKLADGPQSFELAAYMKKRVEETLLSQSVDSMGKLVYLNGEVMVAGEEGEPRTVKVKLPVYKYPHGTRQAAAMAFMAVEKESPAWGAKERNELFMSYQMAITEVTGIDPGETIIEQHLLPPDLARWFLEKDELMGMLMPM